MLNLCKTPKVDRKLDIHLEILTGKINWLMDQLEADEFTIGIPLEVWIKRLHKGCEQYSKRSSGWRWRRQCSYFFLFIRINGLLTEYPTQQSFFISWCNVTPSLCVEVYTVISHASYAHLRFGIIRHFFVEVNDPRTHNTCRVFFVHLVGFSFGPISVDSCKRLRTTPGAISYDTASHPMWVNSSRLGQYGRHFADAIFLNASLIEQACIAIQISRKFVLKGPINNIPALVQIMAWRPGDKPLSEPMLTRFTNAYIRQ